MSRWWSHDWLRHAWHGECSLLSHGRVMMYIVTKTCACTTPANSPTPASEPDAFQLGGSVGEPVRVMPVHFAKFVACALQLDGLLSWNCLLLPDLRLCITRTSRWKQVHCSSLQV